jgi:hypothetical protein
MSGEIDATPWGGKAMRVAVIKTPGCGSVRPTSLGF